MFYALLHWRAANGKEQNIAEFLRQIIFIELSISRLRIASMNFLPFWELLRCCVMRFGWMREFC